MALLFRSDIDPPDWWREVFGQLMPDLDIRVWPDMGEVAEIDFALVWRPEPGMLAGLPNLKAIFSLGAGIDHLLDDPELPRHVPVTRVVDSNLTQRMTEYVLLHVLRIHRRQDEYAALQSRGEWRELRQPAAGDRRVGIMGLGVLGGDAARALAGLGFDTAGYSRTPKDIAGVACLHGPDGLAPFLNRSEILVNLLPLTDATEDILNASLFAALPEGAHVINAGRGRHLVEDDLIAALESGRLAGATLDVFRDEPLPAGHPLWIHPKITVTPHIASIADPRSVARQVVENIRRTRAGETLLDAVDLDAGY